MKKHAPTLTVAALTSVQIPEHVRAIERTMAELPFPAEQLLLSHERPMGWQGNFGRVPFIHDTIDYSQIVMACLHDFVKTAYVIIVQADGYALDGRNWDDRFLDYDYVGAPWPVWHCRSLTRRVGNGGFSLRSRVWLNAARDLFKLGTMGRTPEDWFCCVKQREHFISAGCKVAPVDVALKFSCEHRLPTRFWWKDRQSFGFHGRQHTGQRLKARFWTAMGLQRQYAELSK